jgi:putative RNA 2'-phosphotransferase
LNSCKINTKYSQPEEKIMNEKLIVKKSKYLSKHLRHSPERIGLTLEPGGWVLVEDLLRACARAGMSLSRAELEEVVAKNDKQRFSFDETKTKIRANQGHSVEVDLQLEPVQPPEILYHGTAESNRDSILTLGLEKRNRHHVHLSADTETARRVGARHGKPLVFEIQAGVMQAEGHVFFRSENGVWLVDEVPPEYIKIAN